MFLKCMPPTTPQPLFAHFSETIILLLYQLFNECSVPQTKNSMIVPASGASELPITHIWYSIHTSPCCTSFSSLSLKSHLCPTRCLQQGSLSLWGHSLLDWLFMKTTVNMLIWNTQSHCGLTQLLLFSFTILPCQCQLLEDSGKRLMQKHLLKTQQF